jgi:protein-S-isoprenylcysteine O-methyltransferase Ste14
VIKKVGWLLVIIQFCCIGYFLYQFEGDRLTVVSGLLMAGGMLLGGWSIYVMRKSRLRILPDPASNAVLITNGPYRILRHPMYTAVLLFCAGMVNWKDTADMILFALLLITLLVKLTYEEQMLNTRFGGYKEYTKHSYRLLPYIF